MRGLIVLLCLAMLAGCSTGSTDQSAQLNLASAPATQPTLNEYSVPIIEKRAYAAIVVDARTGKILLERTPPASATPRR